MLKHSNSLIVLQVSQIIKTFLHVQIYKLCFNVIIFIKNLCNNMYLFNYHQFLVIEITTFIINYQPYVYKIITNAY